ncbi:phosphatase PAP2 family protein [Streptomyces sp. NPDC049577]|uniref:phosphatase PAP2 family protein n=1 Tax=Streptomyces sp. NPDC049577 TaxID=3155153 RepID=UPI00342CBBE1
MAAHGPLRTLDERLGRPPLPLGLAHVLADLGDTAVALPVLVAAMAWSVLRSRRWVPVAAAGLAMAAVPAVVVPLKTWIARPAPPGPLAGVAHDGFFPSGHAATAAVAYGAAALLVFRTWRWMPVYALLNAGVGLGLVRCGYHWPLDVLGAWCLAGVLLSGAARWVARKPPAVAVSCRNRPRTGPWREARGSGDRRSRPRGSSPTA